MTDLQTDTFSTPQDDNNDAVPLTEHTVAETRQLGRCKWFAKGYGFIEGIGDDTRDFFVHHTQLGHLDASQETDTHEFRYLMPGETVEFNVKEKPRADVDPNDAEAANSESLNDDTNGKRVMACNVTGIYGGPLMYQTELKTQEELNARYAARNNQTSEAGQDGEFTQVSHRRHGGGRGKGKGKGKGRYGGPGRPTNQRWTHTDGGGYYGQAPPQMGYYGGYYGQAPPLPGYNQPYTNHGFGMHGGVHAQQLPSHTAGPPGQHGGGSYSNNGFAALDE